MFVGACPVCIIRLICYKYNGGNVLISISMKGVIPCKQNKNPLSTRGSNLLSWKDLNLRMQESKSCALPLGDSPKFQTTITIHYN